MTEPVPVAVLLLAYGGPSHLGEVEPFLARVLSPRQPPQTAVRRARQRYAAIGGSSPLVDNTLAQAQALQSYLEGPGRARLDGVVCASATPRVFIGMRYSAPFLADSLASALDFGRGRVVAVIMASHQPEWATEAYRREIDRVPKEDPRRFPCAQVTFPAPWHCHPLYLQAVAEQAWEVMRVATIRTGAVSAANPLVLFTAHSLALDRNRKSTDYEASLEETARGVMARLGPCPWRIAYQSRSPYVAAQWLGPDVEEVMREEAAAGRQRVLVVPLGFVAEHLETLYDLDIELRAVAEECGLSMERASTVQDSAAFIAALGDVILEHLEHSREGGRG